MSLLPLSDRIAVRLLPEPEKPKDVIVTNVTKSTKYARFLRAEVMGIGPKALGMNGVLLHETVLVSENFGDPVQVRLDPETEETWIVGRIRDIAGAFRPDGLRPPTNRVLLERIETEEVRGGIFIPENIVVQYWRGKVVGVGPECTEVKLAQVVLVPKHLFVTVRLDERTLMLADEPTLLAIIS